MRLPIVFPLVLEGSTEDFGLGDAATFNSFILRITCDPASVSKQALAAKIKPKSSASCSLSRDCCAVMARRVAANVPITNKAKNPEVGSIDNKSTSIVRRTLSNIFA